MTYSLDYIQGRLPTEINNAELLVYKCSCIIMTHTVNLPLCTVAKYWGLLLSMLQYLSPAVITWNANAYMYMS